MKLYFTATFFFAIFFTSTVCATPLQILYEGEYFGKRNLFARSFTGRSGPFAALQVQRTVRMFELPMFDPTLGSLLSARVTMDGTLVSERLMHVRSPIVIPTGTAFVKSRLRIESPVNVNVGFTTKTPPIFVDNPSPLGSSQGDIHFVNNYASNTSFFFPGLGNQERSVRGSRTDSSTYDRIFVGNDLESFVSTPTSDIFRFTGATLTGVELPGNIDFPIVDVDGFPITLADIATFAEEGAGQSAAQPPSALAKPGLGTLLKLGALAGLAAVGVSANSNEGHGPLNFYSDLHASAQFGFGATITYTYEPSILESVPEPTTLLLLLLGLGLAGLVFARKRLH